MSAEKVNAMLLKEEGGGYQRLDKNAVRSDGNCFFDSAIVIEFLKAEKRFPTPKERAEQTSALRKVLYDYLKNNEPTMVNYQTPAGSMMKRIRLGDFSRENNPSSWEKFCLDVRKEKVRADLPVVFGYAELLRINVLILSDVNPPFKIFVGEGLNQVAVLHVKGNHYEPLCQVVPKIRLSHPIAPPSKKVTNCSR
jgi:hypothetical protein